MKTTARHLELLLPKDPPPVSDTELWVGIGTTVLVMTIVGYWFVGGF